MSRTWVILTIIVLAGIGVRLSYLASDPHDFRAESIDGELARNLVAGRGFVVNERARLYIYERRQRHPRLTDPATVNYAPLDRHGQWEPEIIESPGGGVLLAGVWEVTGSEYYLPMQILQAIVDGSCALLVFAISMRLFKRRRAALLAAAFYALYLPVAWQSTVVYNDIWAVDLTIAILAVYLQALASPRRWRWLLACGVLTGISIYFHPSALVLPLVLALATIPGLGVRRALGNGLAVTAVALVMLVPWTIHNYEVFHLFIPTRSGFGHVLWDGLGEIHNNFGADWKDEVTYAEVRRLRPDLRVESPAWDNFLLEHFVIPAIEHHPFFYLEEVARRVVLSTVLTYEGAWMHRGPTLPHGRSPSAFASFAISHPFALLEDALQPAVFLLAMLALGLTWRRWRRSHLMLIAVVLAVLLPFIAMHLEARYILPAAFVYLLWIGLGMDLLAEHAAVHLRAGARRTVALDRAV
jgi:4-amino-4-deoxy-L-arabinose transferase-like glycosyltransferase